MPPTTTEDATRERSFRHYVQLARRRWFLLIVPAVVAAGIGAYLAVQEDEVFRSAATVRVGDPSLPVGLLGSRSADIDQLLATAIEVIESDPLQRQVFDSLPPRTVEAFESVAVERIEGTVLVEIDVTALDRSAAPAIAQTWAETYVEVEVARTVGALNERAAEIDAQSASIDEQLVAVNAAIATEAAAVAAAQAGDEPVVISGNESPTLTGLTRQRDGLLAEQSDLRQQANQLELEAALRGSVVDVAFPADIVRGPFGGSPVRTAGVAGVLGLLLGAGLAVARDELDDRIHSAEGLEAAEPGIPILGAVPGKLRRRRKRAMVFDPSAPAAEAFRALRTNFDFMAGTLPRKSAGHVVVVTSPIESEGKSTTAANLGVALGSLGRSVVVVDADLRRGSLHEQFGVDADPGIVDIMVDRQPLDRALRTIVLEEDRHLSLLPGGRHLSPAELFGMSTFSGLIEELSLRADYVIIDAPPVLPVSDALVLGRLADGVVVVVAAGRTRRPNVRSTVESIRQLDINVLGFVLNGVGRAPHGYYERKPETDNRRRVTEFQGFGETEAVDARGWFSIRKALVPRRRCAPGATGSSLG